MSSLSHIMFRLAEVHGQAYARSVSAILPNLPYVPWGYFLGSAFNTLNRPYPGSPVTLLAEDIPDVILEDCSDGSAGHKGLAVSDMDSLKSRLDKAGINLIPDATVSARFNQKDVNELDHLLKNLGNEPVRIGFYSTHPGRKLTYSHGFRSNPLVFPAYRITSYQFFELLNANNCVIVDPCLGATIGNTPPFITPEQAFHSMRGFLESYVEPSSTGIPKALTSIVARADYFQE